MALGSVTSDRVVMGHVEVGTPLIDLIEQTIQIDAGAPVDEGFRMRASSAHKICPRMYALAYAFDQPVNTDVDAELAWKFAVGTGYHTALQEVVLPRLGELFCAWWRCRSCNRLHVGDPMDGPLKYGWISRPERCEECGGKDLANEELSFEWPEIRMTGHCDGILAWSKIEDGAEDEVLELKTASQRAFHGLQPHSGGLPYRDHVVQLHCYMAGAGLRRGRIVYIQKGDASLRESLAEHQVAYDPEIWDEIVERAKGSILAVERLTKDHGPEGPDFPPRLSECKAKRSKRATRCPMADLCFGTKP